MESPRGQPFAAFTDCPLLRQGPGGRRLSSGGSGDQIAVHPDQGCGSAAVLVARHKNTLMTIAVAMRVCNPSSTPPIAAGRRDLRIEFRFASIFYFLILRQSLPDFICMELAQLITVRAVCGTLDPNRRQHNYFI